MAKKERAINPAEAHRKKEKQQQKKKGKEYVQRNKQMAAYQRDNRQFEQEFQELLAAGADMKLLESKLGQINGNRMTMGLMPKTLTDYNYVKKPKRKASKKGKEVEKEDTDSETSSDEDYDPGLADLSSIKIPTGEAPESEGQIFKALTQLPTIECRVFKARKLALEKKSTSQTAPSSSQPPIQAPKFMPSTPMAPPPQFGLPMFPPGVPPPFLAGHPSAFYPPGPPVFYPPGPPPIQSQNHIPQKISVEQTVEISEDSGPTSFVAGQVPKTFSISQMPSAPNAPIQREASITSAPQLRDLRKELVSMVPTSVRRKTAPSDSETT